LWFARPSSPAANPAAKAPPRSRKRRRATRADLKLAGFIPDSAPTSWGRFWLPRPFGQRGVVFPQQVAVARHELLAEVEIHLLPKFLGQLAPDRLVRVGDG